MPSSMSEMMEIDAEDGSHPKTGITVRTMEDWEQYWGMATDEAMEELKKRYEAQYWSYYAWHCAPTRDLFANYKAISTAADQKAGDKVFLEEYAQSALHVIERGRPARVWTVGGLGGDGRGFTSTGPSALGRSPYHYDEADLLLLTPDEHEQWASAANAPKLVVVRQKAFVLPGHIRSETKLTELAAIKKRDQTEVQELGKLHNSENPTAVSSLSTKKAISLWNDMDPKEPVSIKNSPVNFLSIRRKVALEDGLPGWHKHYTLANTLVKECGGAGKNKKKTEVPGDEGRLSYLTGHNDFDECRGFKLLARRGAYSAWHIDQGGVYTFVTLCGNGDEDERPEDVIKLWAVYPTHAMTSNNKEQAYNNFAQYGMTWKPRPHTLIPFIGVLRGDTLIQPPKTIHAPITVTDCFMIGGMAWRDNDIHLQLESARYTSKFSRTVTNEDVKKQWQQVMALLHNKVCEEDPLFSYLTEKEKAEVKEWCVYIHGKVSKCRCSRACKFADRDKDAKCKCIASALVCGNKCHPGLRRAFPECLENS